MCKKCLTFAYSYVYNHSCAHSYVQRLYGGLSLWKNKQITQKQKAENAFIAGVTKGTILRDYILLTALNLVFVRDTIK